MIFRKCNDCRWETGERVNDRREDFRDQNDAQQQTLRNRILSYFLENEQR